MKEYYLDYKNRIKFYRKDSTRIVKYRPRYSSIWAKNIQGRPFRVANYFKPAFFYLGIVERQKDIASGYDKIQRGIWRNTNAIQISAI